MNVQFINHLKCLHHPDKHERLALDAPYLEGNNECIEGLLRCELCNTLYPILEGVPILVRDFVRYASSRGSTYGRWLLGSKTLQMKNYLKELASQLNPDVISNDRYEQDGYWFAPYKWTQYEYAYDDHFLKLLKHKI